MRRRGCIRRSDQAKSQAHPLSHHPPQDDLKHTETIMSSLTSTEDLAWDDSFPGILSAVILAASFAACAWLLVNL